MKNGIKLLEICNNYGSNTDGIGKYARLIVEEFERDSDIKIADYISGYTSDKSKIRMLLSIQMSKVLWKASRMVSEGDYNLVMMEYPFQEYNPLILLIYLALKNNCRKKDVALALSVHEYVRANRLRKYVIDFMAKRADLILVSEPTTQKILKGINQNTYLRNIIGTIFPNKEVAFEDKTKDFLYFGLINRSKAFSEMIDAWGAFNKKGEYHLTVISSSDIDETLVHEVPDVQVIKNLPDEGIDQYLRSSGYMILPIKPEISEVNGTFKTAALYGCVCIGHFERSLGQLGFVINVDDYSMDSFSSGMKEAISLDDETRRTMFDEAVAYGQRFTPQASSRELIDIFNKML